MEIPGTLMVVVAAAGLIGLLLLLGAGHRLLHRKIVSGCGEGICACLLLAVAALGLGIAANLHTWNRLTNEQSIATISFDRLTGSQEFVTVIEYPNGQSVRYLLEGDEWQLDARVLKWKPQANLLGLDAQYRLERLSARHHDINRERTGPRTIYDLSESGGLDLWAVAKQHPKWLPFVDAMYGSAAYLPMADGGEFQVALTQSGLIARPANAAAEQAVRYW